VKKQVLRFLNCADCQENLIMVQMEAVKDRAIEGHLHAIHCHNCRKYFF
jgi:uncharacterized protein with PIN domain